MGKLLENTKTGTLINIVMMICGALVAIAVAAWFCGWLTTAAPVKPISDYPVETQPLWISLIVITALSVIGWLLLHYIAGGYDHDDETVEAARMLWEISPNEWENEQ